MFHFLAFTMMITLAIIRIGKGETRKHTVEAVNIMNLPKLFGVAIYSFMCHHSLPGILTPIVNKKRINLMLIFDFILVAVFYMLLVLTATFAFSENVLQDLYTLNFDTEDVPVFCKYFLELFPVFTVSTNFPISAITLRENLKSLTLKEGGHYSFFTRRLLFPLITIMPPISIAFATTNVGTLVSLTGAYGGSFIQYVIPAMLVYCGRMHIKKVMGTCANKYQSPFKQRWAVILIAIWSVICMVLVTLDHIKIFF